jgi:hypothetical protein
MSACVLADVIMVLLNLSEDFVGRHLSQTDLAALRATCQAMVPVVDKLRHQRHYATCVALEGRQLCDHGALYLPRLVIGADPRDTRWQVLLSLLPQRDLGHDRTLLNLTGRQPLLPTELVDNSAPPSKFQGAVNALDDLSRPKKCALIVATRVAQHGASYATLRPLLLSMRLVVAAVPSEPLRDCSGRALVGSVISSGGSGTYVAPPLLRPPGSAQLMRYMAKVRRLQREHFCPLHGEALLCFLLYHGHNIPIQLLSVALSSELHVALLAAYAKVGETRRRERLVARKAVLATTGRFADYSALTHQLRVEGLTPASPAITAVLECMRGLLHKDRLAVHIRAGVLLHQAPGPASLPADLAPNDALALRARVFSRPWLPKPIPLLLDSTLSNMALLLHAVPLSLLHHVAEFYAGWYLDVGPIVRRLTENTRLRGTPPPLAVLLQLGTATITDLRRWVQACLTYWPAAVAPLLAHINQALSTQQKRDVMVRRVVRHVAMDVLLAAVSNPVPMAFHTWSTKMTQWSWLMELLTAPEPDLIPQPSPLEMALLATPPGLEVAAWLLQQGAPVQRAAWVSATQLGLGQWLYDLVTIRVHLYAGARFFATNAEMAQLHNEHMASVILPTNPLPAKRVAVAPALLL